MRSVLRFGFLALCLLSACASSSTAVQTASVRVRAADLYPFDEGNAWSYEVDTGQSSPTLAVTRVESFDGRTAVLQSGQQRLRYELRDEGIYIPAEAVWLLKAPLRVGQSWPSRGGRTAEISATDESVSTLGGDFSGCLRVTEAGGRADQQISTVYCPGVGPVKLESTVSSVSSERAISVRAALRGYDVNPSSRARASLP